MKTSFLSFIKKRKPRTNKGNGEKMRTVFTSMCAIAALVAALWVSPVQAAGSGNVTVTVTLSSASVAVTDATIAVGTAGTPAAMSTTYITAAAIHVTNNSGGTTQTYTLSITNDGADWTAATTIGNDDEYILSALFNSAQPGAGDFLANDMLSTGDVICSATNCAFALGDETGAAVAAAEVRHLWLKFETPDVTTTYTAQVITVTVTAVADA